MRKPGKWRQCSCLPCMAHHALLHGRWKEAIIATMYNQVYLVVCSPKENRLKTPPDKMPLSILTESRSIRLSGVNRFPVSVAHREVHLHASDQKVSSAIMSPIQDPYTYMFQMDSKIPYYQIRNWITKLSWLVQVPNLRSQICSSKGNQVIST